MNKLRLWIETKIWLKIILMIPMLFVLYNIIAEQKANILLVLVFVVLFEVVMLLVIMKKTNKWWYNEYDDNKWGKLRRIFTALDSNVSKDGK
jgi:uncharacterized membrane protein